jgi:RNA polymerase sigma factor (sigma-70 family)
MTFEEYAAERLPALLRYAAVLAADRDLAQDIVQEVMARVYVKWQKISQLDAPDQYVRRMIANEFVSWRRRWGRVVPVGQVLEYPQAYLPDTASAHADREALLADLARLPRRQQAVLVLRYYGGLSDTEIAKALGCRDRPRGSGVHGSGRRHRHRRPGHLTAAVRPVRPVRPAAVRVHGQARAGRRVRVRTVQDRGRQ